MKHLAKIFKSKAFYVASGLVLQAVVLAVLLVYFSNRFLPIYYFMVILSVFICILIISRDSDSNSKLLWVFLIMAMPVFGGVIYLLFGERKIPKALMIQDRQAYSDYKQYANQNLKTLSKTGGRDYILDKMMSMAWTNGYFPVYENCRIVYYPSGEKQFQAILTALKSAEKFIFIETFILNQGKMWDSILEILLEKAKNGVDVRFIYDDFGAITHMDPHYDRWLESQGIHTHIFNPMHPQLAMQMNNRDHRKMIIVDGHTAFTGGINIADEYINSYKRFGYWKDMGVRMQGKAVEMFTISFLQIWNYQAEQNTPYEQFILPESEFHIQAPGYVIPFSDSPTDAHDTGKNMHMNMFNLAKDYLWITTPYLILDSEMVSTIKLALANSVDVRIVVPGIPDKKMVYSVTKANYETLIKAGAKIYEYTPGFIHGKVCLSDDESALVGTVNMDSRSYYINYECGVWMHKVEGLSAIKKDFEEIFEASHLVTYEECRNVNPIKRFYRNTLKVFSPLL